MRPALLTLVAVSALLTAPVANAAIMHFTAHMDGASETPANTAAGTGTATVDFDVGTSTASWKVTYGGLSGPATGAHFHGPAPAGKAAGVEVPLSGDLASPIKGSAKLTDTQAADLKGGLWYVNVHTAAHPGGEIRGQVLPGN